MKRPAHPTTHAEASPSEPTLDLTASGGLPRSGAYAARVRSAVAEVVRQQADRGLDIVDDGEMGSPAS